MSQTTLNTNGPTNYPAHTAAAAPVTLKLDLSPILTTRLRYNGQEWEVRVRSDSGNIPTWCTDSLASAKKVKELEHLLNVHAAHHNVAQANPAAPAAPRPFAFPPITSINSEGVVINGQLQRHTAIVVTNNAPLAAHMATIYPDAQNNASYKALTDTVQKKQLDGVPVTAQDVYEHIVEGSNVRFDMGTGANTQTTTGSAGGSAGSGPASHAYDSKSPKGAGASTASSLSSSSTPYTGSAAGDADSVSSVGSPPPQHPKAHRVTYQQLCNNPTLLTSYIGVFGSLVEAFPKSPQLPTCVWPAKGADETAYQDTLNKLLAAFDDLDEFQRDALRHFLSHNWIKGGALEKEGSDLLKAHLTALVAQQKYLAESASTDSS